MIVDRKVEKFKACLVARSFEQDHGIDYQGTFVLIVK